jgi:ribosomal-protein-alanine N-acetyltransferase
MRESDVAAVAELEALCFPSAPGKSPAVDEREARLRQELARPWSRSWVVRDAAGVAVAFAVVWLVVDEVHVLNVATHPGHRRRGLGTRIVQVILDYARERRCVCVRLEVRRGNDEALRLYRAAGFSLEGVRRAYYPDGEDAVDMSLSLVAGHG